MIFAREERGDKSQVKRVVGQLVHDPVGRIVDRRKSIQIDSRRFARRFRDRAGCTQSTGLFPGRRVTAGNESNSSCASQSSPAPNTRGWLASTCSVSDVPERGSPTTKTGRSVSMPNPRIVLK